MLVTPSPIVIFASVSHPENALAPMFVTLPGMVILVSESQPQNAASPIFSTPLPKVTPVISVQP